MVGSAAARVEFARIAAREPIPLAHGALLIAKEEYPALISSADGVQTVAVGAVLVAYNWPRGSEPYRRVEDFTGRLFSKLKAYLRSAAARTVDGLIEAMGEALRAIRPGDIAGWFGHSGYRAPPSTDTLNRKPL